MTKASACLANQTRLDVDSLTSPLSASLFSNDNISSKFQQSSGPQKFVGPAKAKKAMAFWV
jgi:hypothetical protein